MPDLGAGRVTPPAARVSRNRCSSIKACLDHCARSKTLDRNIKGLAPLEKAFESNKRFYFLAGYGVSRRLSHTGIIQNVQKSDRAGAVPTLFDPDAELLPLASWAMELHYTGGEHSLELIRSALDALLPHSVRFMHIDKARKILIFDTADGPVSLADLSDG